MGFSRAVRRGLLDHFFSKTSYTPPTSFYVGVSSTIPTSTGGNLTEPLDPGYSRQATLAVNWDATLDADPVVAKNNIQVAFAQATEDWFNGSPIQSVVLFDAASGGNMIAFGQYARAKSVYQDDILVMEVGKIFVSIN